MKSGKKRILPSSAQFERELNRLRNKRSRHSGLRYILVVSLTAGALIILATNLWFPVLRVMGTSMQPQLATDDIIVCFDADVPIERGNIIAFHHNDTVLLKRVVGIAGDMIEIDDEGILYVNGEPQAEPYASEFSLEPCDITFPVLVPENSMFVLGDKRSTSMDSRSETIGMITEERLIGKALIRIWPISKIELL